MRHLLKCIAFGIAVIILTPSLAVAQVSPPPDMPASPTAPAAAPEFGGSAGGDFSFGQLGEDWFVTVRLMATFAFSKLQIGLQVPLRLRVIDNAPEDEDIVRKEDWDEISDYFKIIRFIQWSTPGDTFYARIGEFSGTSIGHGTLMNNYLNVIDIDHFQLGIDTQVNTIYGGGEFVIDNVVRPEVFGGRLYARPIAFADTESYFTRWSVGTTFLTDINAPDTLELDPITNTPTVDDKNNILFDAKPVYLYGVDTDFTVFSNDIIAITPYMDHNFLFTEDMGYGFHFGILNTLTLPMESGVELRLEYQYLGARYQPQYIDTQYEVQRAIFPSPSVYPVGEPPLTKQAVAGSTEDGANGFLGQLSGSILGYVNLTGMFRWSERPFDGELLIQATMPKISVVKVGVTYSKSGFDSVGDAFNPDGALFSAFARVNTGSPIDVIASFSRRWQLNTDPGDEDYGKYETVDEWGAGVGISFDF